VKNCAKLFFFLFTGLLSIIFIESKGNSYQLAKKYTDTGSILLKEVVVLSEPSDIFSSETPKKMSEIICPLTFWQGVLMNEPELFNKELMTFSIYTTNKRKSTKVFELDFYTLGENGLPEKKLNETPFQSSLYKKGWNEFEIPSHIVIPENGIIVAVRFEKRKVDWHTQEKSIGLGVYTNHKPTYILDGKKWKDFPIDEMHQEKYENRVSLMLKISTHP
jgi:hypothetical protein